MPCTVLGMLRIDNQCLQHKRQESPNAITPPTVVGKAKTVLISAGRESCWGTRTKDPFHSKRPTCLLAINSKMRPY